MTSHELAAKLLSEPNIQVAGRDPQSGRYFGLVSLRHVRVFVEESELWDEEFLRAWPEDPEYINSLEVLVIA
jgi:hypothetical protein